MKLRVVETKEKQPLSLFDRLFCSRENNTLKHAQVRVLSAGGEVTYENKSCAKIFGRDIFVIDDILILQLSDGKNNYMDVYKVDYLRESIEYLYKINFSGSVIFMIRPNKLGYIDDVNGGRLVIIDPKKHGKIVAVKNSGLLRDLVCLEILTDDLLLVKFSLYGKCFIYSISSDKFLSSGSQEESQEIIIRSVQVIDSRMFYFPCHGEYSCLDLKNFHSFPLSHTPKLRCCPTNGNIFYEFLRLRFFGGHYYCSMKFFSERRILVCSDARKIELWFIPDGKSTDYRYNNLVLIGSVPTNRMPDILGPSLTGCWMSDYYNIYCLDFDTLE